MKYLIRLLATIFMPLMLITLNTFLIFWVTFFVKQCQFREVANRKPLNCGRLCNRVSIAFGIQLFLIYPAILHILFASMQCFDSLSDLPEESGELMRRM